jgi:hypothetical protein
VARSNVCPEIDPPAEPSFYAFSFTRPTRNTMPSFVIAGSGEAREGGATYAERTVRYRDLSPGGFREKVEFVAGAMEHRMGQFNFGWKETTAVQTYTVHDFIPSLPTRWFDAARRVRAWPGISRARRSSISNTRWIAAA